MVTAHHLVAFAVIAVCFLAAAAALLAHRRRGTAGRVVAQTLAIAFFIYLVWRERREEIGTWDARERAVFYGSALLIVADLGTYFWHGFNGYDELGFIAVLACAGFAMFRFWRDRHTY